MRVVIVAIVAIVVGCVLGIGTTWRHEVYGVVNYFEPVRRLPGTAQPEDDQDGEPLVIVEGGPKFQFSTIEFNASDQHTFVLKNEGKKTLTLSSPEPSCGKCIETEFTGAEVPPGGSTEVTITYSARKEGQQFAEGLTLSTNDPRNRRLRLEITGVVTLGVRSYPTELALGSVSVTDGATTTVNLFGYRSPTIELLEHTFSNPTTAELYELQTEPLSSEEIKKTDEHASAGIAARITIKPGLPLGRITQTITFKVRSDAEHSVDVPIDGEVVGDITLVGRDYKSEAEMLLLGIVDREVGRTSKLHILVKGPHRNDVKITVGDVDPPGILRATVGEGVPIGDGKAVDFPLTVEVVKGSPAVSRLGNAQGKNGTIMLETTHPKAKKIQVPVRFAVE